MSKNNDERILKLQQVLKQKQSDLKKRQERFSPVTTCIIDLGGERYNLHTCNKESLLSLLLKLETMSVAADRLKESEMVACGDITTDDIDNIKISGFTIDQWKQDITSRLACLKYQTLKAELNKADKQLSELLSDDKKTELAVDSIAKLLGE